MTKSELNDKIIKNTKTIKSLTFQYWGTYMPQNIKNQINHLINKNKVYQQILNY